MCTQDVHAVPYFLVALLSVLLTFPHLAKKLQITESQQNETSLKLSGC